MPSSHDAPRRPRRRRIRALAIGVFALGACLPAAAPAVQQVRLATPIRVAPIEATMPAIVNGQLVSAGAYDARWRAMVALHDEAGLLCGGTLIDSRSVVTAAHCVRSGSATIPPSSLSVVVGRRVRSVPDGDVVPVERIDVHPSFDLELVRNDIALLRLSRAPATSYATIEPLAWHDVIWPQLGRGWPVGGDLVGPWIAGWGVTDPDRPRLQDELREAKVPVHADAACSASTAPGLGWQFDPASMICAGVAGTGDVSGGGVDACQGDSGGPLLVGDGAGTWRLVGITSWGTGCATSRWAAWTRVGAYTAWLDAHRFAPPVRPDPNAPLPPPPAPPTDGGPSVPAAPAPDLTAPSTPGPLAARGVTASACTVRWAASSDDVGIARYQVQWYTGAAWRHLSFETVTSISVRSMTPGGLYRFRVRAFDAAGNASPWSTPLAVRMVADRVRPSSPGAPRYGSVTPTSVVVAWRAARDNVQVRRYVVWRRVSARRWMVVARPIRPRVTLRGLAVRRALTFRVQAVDTAGNRSLPSIATTVRLG